jgi:hypothetical protein
MSKPTFTYTLPGARNCARIHTSINKYYLLRVICEKHYLPKQPGEVCPALSKVVVYRFHHPSFPFLKIGKVSGTRGTVRRRAVAPPS